MTYETDFIPIGFIEDTDSNSIISNLDKMKPGLTEEELVYRLSFYINKPEEDIVRTIRKHDRKRRRRRKKK